MVYDLWLKVYGLHSVVSSLWCVIEGLGLSISTGAFLVFGVHQSMLGFIKPYRTYSTGSVVANCSEAGSSLNAHVLCASPNLRLPRT